MIYWILPLLPIRTSDEYGDLESKDCVIAMGGSNHAVCDGYTKGARFIDARTVQDGIPWYETGDNVMKVTAK